MAADILAYDSDLVPVGSDQKQHIEITRDLVIKFNEAYGPTLKPPEPSIREEAAIVPGLDGEKMSKSYGNTIAMFEEERDDAKEDHEFENRLNFRSRSQAGPKFDDPLRSGQAGGKSRRLRTNGEGLSRRWSRLRRSQEAPLRCLVGVLRAHAATKEGYFGGSGLRRGGAA